jgi:hypothetical protein
MKKERNINEERNKRDLEVIMPIYNRSRIACAKPGQTHLQRFENAN